MRFPSPAGRVAAVLVAAGALVAGGAAYAASDTPVSHLDDPASASVTAVRVTTTTTEPAFVTAPQPPTKGPGTLPFPMDPEPTCVLYNNYGDGRSGSRSHEGTDIKGDLGQNVYAVEDGVLYRQWIDGEAHADLSGNGWNLQGESGATYSFLHLSGFAPGLEVGSEVVEGQLIGYVGDTGNPGAGNYHLHFEVHPDGEHPVDPYPLLDVPVACTVYGS